MTQLREIVERLDKKTQNIHPVYVMRDVITRSGVRKNLPVCVAYVYKVPMHVGRSLYYCVEVVDQNPVTVRRICMY